MFLYAEYPAPNSRIRSRSKVDLLRCILAVGSTKERNGSQPRRSHQAHPANDQIHAVLAAAMAGGSISNVRRRRLGQRHISFWCHYDIFNQRFCYMVSPLHQQILCMVDIVSISFRQCFLFHQDHRSTFFNCIACSF